VLLGLRSTPLVPHSSPLRIPTKPFPLICPSHVPLHSPTPRSCCLDLRFASSAFFCCRFLNRPPPDFFPSSFCRTEHHKVKKKKKRNPLKNRPNIVTDLGMKDVPASSHSRLLGRLFTRPRNQHSPPYFPLILIPELRFFSEFMPSSHIFFSSLFVFSDSNIFRHCPPTGA